MFRQGDLLFVPVSTIPASATAVDRENGRLVLARGEATGHAHAVLEPEVELLQREIEPGVAYLKVAQECHVTHEEHAPITLAPGNYRVIHQREYSPSTRERLVRD